MRLYYIFVFAAFANTKIATGQEVTQKQDTTIYTPHLLSPLPDFRIEPQNNSSNQNPYRLYEQEFKLPEFEFNYHSPTHPFANKLKPYIVPIGLMSLALYSMSDAAEGSFLDKRRVRNNIQNQLPSGYHTKIDNYMQYAPLALGTTLKLIGVEGKNDRLNSILLAQKANLLTGTIVQGLKKLTGVQRPDQSSFTSFPSGHTATAFCYATIVHMEYGEKSVWYSIAAYSMATATGAMRMMNDKHWLPDVLAGAAIGIASTKFVYATHQYRWGKKTANLVIVPTFSSNGFGINLACTF